MNYEFTCCGQLVLLRYVTVNTPSERYDFEWSCPAPEESVEALVQAGLETLPIELILNDCGADWDRSSDEINALQLFFPDLLGREVMLSKSAKES